MAELKEAIELLTKDVAFWDNFDGKVAELPRKNYDLLLAKLKEQQEPKCKTCGGRGRYHNCDTWGCSSVEHINKAEPCPDCKEQPPAGKFTKECRELRKRGATHEQWEYAGKMMEACGRLDRSEARLKKLVVACKKIQKINTVINAAVRLEWMPDLS